MNTGRSRKKSLNETHTPSFVPALKPRRRRSLQGKNSRDKDFFVPDEVEEWVLPEYRSLFHHLFLREDEEHVEGGGINSEGGSSASPSSCQRKKSDSGGSHSSDDDGAFGNFVKWLRKLFQHNEDQQQAPNDMDRHAWLDEIPIEICDKLRHIHIYV